VDSRQVLVRAFFGLGVCTTLPDCSRPPDDVAQNPADENRERPLDDAGERSLADESQLEAEQLSFWNDVAICGEAADSYQTVFEAAENSEAAVLARFVGIAVGPTVQGDAAEDFVGQVRITVQVTQVLKHESEPQFELGLLLAHTTPTLLPSTIDRMHLNLPKDEVLLLVRKRVDIPNLYVLVALDKGLWTRTVRARLDNPIAATSCGGHSGDEVRSQFLEGARTMDELVSKLRR